MPESDISGSGFNIETGPDYPFHSSSPVNGGGSGGGGMLGVNQLQSAIDRFDAAVDKLAALYGKASGGGLPGQGGGSSPSSGNNGGGARFSGIHSAANSIYAAAFGSQLPKGLHPSTWGGGGTGQGFIGQASFNGQGSSQGQPGASPGGGTYGGLTTVTPGKLRVAGFAEVIGSVATFGKASLPTQLGMSSMIQSGMLMSPAGTSVNAGGAAIRSAAFGTPGVYNTMATSSQDAMAGYGVLSQASGSYNLRGGLAQGMLGAAQGLTYANQGMGFGAAAAIGQQIYSPQTALRMQMMGYGTTGRQMGGGTNTFQAVLQGQMQRMYQGRGSINPAQLAKNLAPGNIGSIDVAQATGLQGQDLQDYISTMEAYNKVTFSGKTYDQAAQLFAQASKGNKSARSQLDKLDISETETQRLMDNQATKTGGQSDIYNSFNSGMTTATSSMNAFNTAINAFLNSPAGQALGYGAGAVGGLSTGSAGSLLQGGGGIAMMLAARKMATSAGAAGAGETALEGGGAAGAAGLAAAMGPAMLISGGLLAGAFIKGIGDKLAPANSKAGIINNQSQKDNPSNPITNVFGGFISKAVSLIPGVPGGGSSGDAGNSKAGAGAKNKANTPSRAGSGISGQAKKAVGDAQSQLGVPYVWGGESPGKGFDCSGLTQWAYSSAGVSIPRTSQAQWAYLQSHKKSIALNKVQEGDLIFKGGSDGTADSPGHVAMMISNNRYVEAYATGYPIRDKAYNPGEWSHAGRPTGSTAGSAKGGVGSGGSGSGTGSGSGGGTATAGGTTGMTNFGSAGGSPNSTSEADNVAAALGGGTGGGVSMGMGGGGTATASSATPAGTGSKATGKNAKGKTANTKGITGGGTKAQNRVLMKRMAAAYGWGSGQEWADLDWLENAEAGYDNHIWNGTGSGAYGMPQALPYTKMPKAAWPESAGGKSDPKTQIDWMLHYIKTSGNFNDPTSAKAFHLAHNWYADGTTNAKRGPAIVGERGPEEIYLQGGEQIRNAKQVAQAPWKAKEVAGNTASGCSGNHGVSLTFGPGSVVIGSNGSGGSVETASNSAREFVNQVKQLLGKENLYDAIATGKKGG